MKNVVYRTPEELKKKTRQNSKKNRHFLETLRKKKPDSLDTFVHTLHKEAFSRFNCLDCANCCKTIGPRLIPSDIERMARYLKMKVPDFYTKFIIADEDDDLVFADHPCPFLQSDNYCMVYKQRPRACREYPHTDRKRLHQILDLTFKNCETCPVVFDIVEEINRYLCRY